MRWAALLLVPLFLLTPCPLVGAEPRPKDLRAKTEHVLEVLATLVPFPAKGDENLVDRKTTLGEILHGVLGPRYNIEFIVDEAAFADAGKDERFQPLDAKVLETPLSLVDVSVEDLLRQLLARVPFEAGVTFLVDRGNILITTVSAQRARIWGKAHKGPYPPIVYANFQRVPLLQAVQDIATKGSVTLIVSDVVAEKMRMPITTQLINAPLDTAAVMLADIADFQPVFKDNLLYITTRENANRLEREFKKRDREAKPQPTKPSPGPEAEPMKPAK
jgi:hypothetical protein